MENITETAETAETETVVVELPAKFLVTGARGKKYILDMTKAKPEQVQAALSYWFGVVTQRAGASESGSAKIDAEVKKAKALEKWDWNPGQGGGGGKRLTLREKAERAILESLFRGQGLKAAEATKAAKAETAWRDYIKAALKAADLPADNEAVTAELEAQQEAIDSMVQAEVSRLEALQKATKGLQIGA